MDEYKKIVSILKSGKFTFVYCDTWRGCLIPQKIKNKSKLNKYFEDEKEMYDINICDYDNILFEIAGGVVNCDGI